jgi:regulator of cell morphogenesis and NO signaling
VILDSPMNGTTPTVNDLIARFPDTVATFNAFGIDACCGGAVPVREAALRDGADPDALLAALAEVVGQAHTDRARFGA